MSEWNVRLKFQLESGDSPTSTDWEELSGLAGAIMGWSGDGPPSEFTSVISIQADTDAEAIQHAVANAREALARHRLDGWNVGGILIGDDAVADDGYDPGDWTGDDEGVGYDPGPPG